MKALALLVALGVGVLAAAPSAEAQSLTEETIFDLQGVAEKMITLTGAVPESEFDWRPMEGVRSIGEVYMHVASANFRFPGMLGSEPPAGTPDAWIRGDAEGVDADTAARALTASFRYLIRVVNDIDDLDAPMDVFGRSTNVRGFLIVMTTHLHEHLGQSIAYARTRGIVPPWSGAP